MTNPIEPAPTAIPPQSGPDDAPPEPAVQWTPLPSPGDPSKDTRQRRGRDIVVSVGALVVLAILSFIRAVSKTGLEASEAFGYVVGGIVGGLLIAAAIRWLWLRTRRRGDPAARLLSPWIPVGAVILVVLSMLGSNRN
jgi:hypothetical protein